MPIELIPGDFNEDDWSNVEDPIQDLIVEIGDLMFHEVTDGYWVTPESLRPRTVAHLIEHARGVLDRLDSGIRSAEAAIAAVERDARLRAIHRLRRSGGR